MSNSIEIDVSKLADKTMEIFTEFSHLTEIQCQEAIDEVGKEARDIVKSSGTYKDRTGKYRKSIKYSKGKVKSDIGYLTHLLENGHAIVGKGGRKIGTSKSFPHWTKGQEFAEKELIRVIKRKIENEGNI